ncbi:histone acetyltransferase KAT6B-like [Tubulanus polymorphus]|uniref:histone acetyltransferase KAT6B-like n=1 Tax=Tubulanus polymorphus TaxID=672921 RepID=UPI003DA6B2D7
MHAGERKNLPNISQFFAAEKATKCTNSTIMPAVKHKDTILGVIDQLRNRKARPDLDHISHMVQRRYGLNRSETESILERLVELELVIKVEYKGSTSYRNAAKWKKSGIGGNVLNSNETSVYIQRAIEEINASKSKETEPADQELPSSSSADCEGVGLQDIQAWVEVNVDNTAWLKKNSDNAVNLSTALDREVDSGRIRKLPNKRYVFVDPAERKASPLTIRDRLNNSADTENAAFSAKTPTPPPGKVVKKGRPPLNKKRKPTGNTSNGATKAKKENVTVSPQPPAAEEKAMDIEPTPPGDENVVKCRLCYLTPETNRDGQPEDMLTCKECNSTVHPSCMNYSSDLAERALRSPWQCYECKTCCLCSEAGEAAELLFCDACDKGYHMQCHKPKVLENPKGLWECSSCLLEQQNGLDTSDRDEEMDACNTEGGGPSCLPTPCESPISFDDDLNVKVKEKFSEKKFMESVLKKIDLDGRLAGKDATEWTIDDVAEFITRAGFPEQASRFSDQEIDGKSLLLMQRNDVLTGLSMKLGPALKIYSHIHKLQTTCSENL